MKIRPSKSTGNAVMELGNHNSECLSEPATVSPFKLGTILVPLDFSNCSKKALKYALPFAKQFNATIVLIHVVSRRCTMGDKLCVINYEPESEKGLCENAAQQLKEFAAEFLPREIRVRVKTCLGAEAVEIAAEAKNLKVDLIVISTHGRTGRAHALAGSVAENLVHLAPCPVLVVREHGHDFVLDESKPCFQKLNHDN